MAKKHIKILVGGVPYGCDNVGDEAILLGIVDSLKKALPSAVITVSTRTPLETARKLRVRTVPLYGFVPPRYSHIGLLRELFSTDIFLWGGATGLSDYPGVPLYLGRLAKLLGKKLVLYSVGMNDELNPSFYKLRPGGKTTILRFLGRLFDLKEDPVRKYEQALAGLTRKKIKRLLNKADLVIVRDEQTKALLSAIGVTADVHATADPAVLIEPVSGIRLDRIWKGQKLWEDDKPIVVFGISSQSKINQVQDVALLADHLIKERFCHVLYVSMGRNDRSVSDEIMKKMLCGDEARVLEGFFEPEEIAGILGKASLVISSRLHLLILASISGAPIAGISRGSKIDNFLSLFGERSCGGFESFDPEALKRTAVRLLKDQAAYRKKAGAKLEELKAKARENIRLLEEFAGKSF